jgi:hypothetical protein
VASNVGAQSFDNPDDFAAALRNSLSQDDTVELLFAIWEQNVRTVRALNKGTRRGTGRNSGRTLQAARRQFGESPKLANSDN